jgi:putative heme iron utilization protein
MSQIGRNLTDAVDGILKGKRYLIHDRDPLFTTKFLDMLADVGVKSVKLPPRSPNLNAHAERFVRSVKESCLQRAVEVRGLYLSRYENAKYWQDYTDFAYYRLEVSGVYFIGGFGVMGWVSAEDYGSALPDPLAEAAPGIIQHMNADHADALRLIAHRFAGEAADEAAMTAVDRLGFHLRLKSGDRIHGRRVAFLQEVKSSDAARVALVEMVRQARSPEVV